MVICVSMSFCRQGEYVEESQSRAPYLDANERHLFEDKWGKSVELDRFYNERFLTVSPPTFEPAIHF